MAIYRVTDTEYYCIFVWVCGGQYRGELILNITVYFVKAKIGDYLEELITNVTVLIVRVWGG